MEWIDQNNTVLGRRRRTQSVIKFLNSNPQVESVVNFVAEWFSHGEMKVLQGVSLLMSVWVREWQYKDVLPDFDSQMWEDQSEEWQKYMSEKRRKSCLVKTPVPRDVPDPIQCASC